MNNISTIPCPKCNRPVRTDKKSCFYCGQSLKDIKVEIKCSKCGAELKEHENFCTNCGNGVIKEKSYTSGIPDLPENFLFSGSPVRSISFTRDYMDIEKTQGPPVRLSWNDIRELNCYHIDVYEDEDEISPVNMYSRDNCMKLARYTGKRFDNRTTDDNLITYYIMELFSRKGEREFFIDYKFNYGKALGAEKDFNRAVNFKKLVRKIAEHLTDDVKMGNGTGFLLAGG